MTSPTKVASWIIRRRDTCEVIMETFSPRVLMALKPEFEAIPIMKYLQDLNSEHSGGRRE